MSEPRAAGEARSVREALAAQLLGELDGLVRRVEDVRGQLAALDAGVLATAKTLTEASDGYRLAVTQFTDAAKADLQEYVQRKAALIAEESAHDHKAALQDVAREVFRVHALDEVDRLAQKLRAATARAPAWHGAALAAAGGAAGAGVMVLLLRALGLL